MRAVHQSLARLQAPRHVAITPVHYIELSRLEPSSRAPRRTMEDANLERLADSLLRHGPLQPVLVGPERNGRYELIFGLRRYYAACAAGLRALPALIWEGPPEDAEVLALVENLA